MVFACPQTPHYRCIVAQVTFEASPITTVLEKCVGNRLCEMLGYTVTCKKPSKPDDDEQKTVPWGHIACDGTVANMESMW